MSTPDPEEERGRALVRDANDQVHAPAELRERLRADARRRRTRIVAGAATAAAVATATVLALTLPGDVPDRPTLVQAAELAERPADRPAPARDPADPRRLAVRVDGVDFPDWAAIRWPATGMRTDRLDDDRSVTTVFYVRAGRHVAYQVVSGDPLPPPVATEQELVGETVYRTFRAAGRTIVTWVSGGRTCIVSARGVRPEILRRLAAWEATPA